MLYVYRLVYLPVLLIMLPYYLFRMWRRGGYKSGFLNRFGMFDKVPRKCDRVKRIWIQAVSVGEVLAVKSLIERLRATSEYEVILTTTTSTAFRLIQERFTEITIYRGIFPLDFWPVSHLSWEKLNPDMVILMEGEVWPEHLHQAKKRQIPVVLINARLSDKSFQRHKQLKNLVKPLVSDFSTIICGSESDLARFRSLNWIAEEKIQYSGNLKLDVSLESTASGKERNAFLQSIGFISDGVQEDSPVVLLGASTWPGEEELLVEVFEKLYVKNPQLRLIIVPRHAERKPAIKQVLSLKNLNIPFRSETPVVSFPNSIYIADTTGELKFLTSVADIVFVGKSIPPNTGGQTPIEAAAFAKPLLFGPEMSNFRDISSELIRTGAAHRVENAEDLSAELDKLLSSREVRLRQGKAAADCILNCQGATEKTLAVLKKLLQN